MRDDGDHLLSENLKKWKIKKERNYRRGKWRNHEQEQLRNEEEVITWKKLIIRKSDE